MGHLGSAGKSCFGNLSKSEPIQEDMSVELSPVNIWIKYLTDLFFLFIHQIYIWSILEIEIKKPVKVCFVVFAAFRFYECLFYGRIKHWCLEVLHIFCRVTMSRVYWMQLVNTAFRVGHLCASARVAGLASVWKPTPDSLLSWEELVLAIFAFFCPYVRYSFN